MDRRRRTSNPRPCSGRRVVAKKRPRGGLIGVVNSARDLQSFTESDAQERFAEVWKKLSVDLKKTLLSSLSVFLTGIFIHHLFSHPWTETISSWRNSTYAVACRALISVPTIEVSVLRGGGGGIGIYEEAWYGENVTLQLEEEDDSFP